MGLSCLNRKTRIRLKFEKKILPWEKYHSPTEKFKIGANRKFQRVLLAVSERSVLLRGKTPLKGFRSATQPLPNLHSLKTVTNYLRLPTVKVGVLQIVAGHSRGSEFRYRSNSAFRGSKNPYSAFLP